MGFLLCFISLLTPEVVLPKSELVDCNCLGLANVRKLIPDGAVQAKQLLYQFWKITQENNFCRSTLQSIPITSLGLGRRKRNKVTLGTFVKSNLEELKIRATKHIWKSWHQNRLPSLLPEVDENLKDELDIRINRTMDELEEKVDRWTENMNFFTENILTESKEIVSNHNFLESYTLDFEDVKAAINGLHCTFTKSSHVLDFNLGKPGDFKRVIESKGVENFDVDDARRLLEKSVKTMIHKDATVFLKNTMKKFRSLVQSFLPEIHNFGIFFLEIMSGKNIQFENLIIRILEELQKDTIMVKMDQIFADTCLNLRKLPSLINVNNKQFLSRFLEIFLKLASHSITENNKIDFDKFVGLLSISHDVNEEQERLNRLIQRIVSKLDRLEEGLKEGWYASQFFDFFLPVMFPETTQDDCTYQILKEKSKVITAGAFQAIVLLL